MRSSSLLVCKDCQLYILCLNPVMYALSNSTALVSRLWLSAVQNDPIGKALRECAAAVILGHGRCKTLFIHAGLSAPVLQTLLRHSQSSHSSIALLNTLNAQISGMLQPKSRW